MLLVKTVLENDGNDDIVGVPLVGTLLWRPKKIKIFRIIRANDRHLMKYNPHSRKTP